MSGHVPQHANTVVFLMGDDEPADIDPIRVNAYAVIRPWPLASVAEGAIAVKPSSEEHYLTCQATHTLKLTASGDPKIDIRGLPVMDQDGVASSCAHASLWVASRLVAATFPDCPAAQVLTYKDIDAAVRSQPAMLGRRLPTAGLNLQEMLMALESNGYAPISYVFETADQVNRADQIVYRYIESGLPVILLLKLEDGGHSVVAAGHTFDKDAWWPGARRDHFPSLAAEDQWLSSALWTPEYILVDDNYGPALTMTRGGLRNRAFGSIVPLPREARIFVTAEDAESLVAGTLFGDVFATVLDAVHAVSPGPWIPWLLQALRHRSEQLVLRTFLRESEKLRHHVLSSTEYASQTKDAIRSLQMPERIWLVEISVPSLFGEKLKLGEVAVNPHIPRPVLRQPTDALVWLHVTGMVWAPPGPTVDPVATETETPTTLLLRHSE